MNLCIMLKFFGQILAKFLQISQYKYFENNETITSFIIFEIFILRHFEQHFGIICPKSISMTHELNNKSLQKRYNILTEFDQISWSSK